MTTLGPNGLPFPCEDPWCTYNVPVKHSGHFLRLVELARPVQHVRREEERSYFVTFTVEASYRMLNTLLRIEAELGTYGRHLGGTSEQPAKTP